ncbi:hypothetical protein AN217_26485 [Streptomyces qinglanensis]|uniref:Uncharacterized protein n=1 Tax=Streptomyces qinglanensis TaxID=943816 RepID=A0A1E7K9Z6_9ACTN|nr:hypothetical protein AN217_26485 [Streptomyces qinglanensis]
MRRGRTRGPAPSAVPAAFRTAGVARTGRGDGARATAARRRARPGGGPRARGPGPAAGGRAGDRRGR